MNATIGVYDDHDMAMEAIAHLQEKGYDVTKLSIMGLSQTEEVDPDLNVSHKMPYKSATTTVGTAVALGTTVGLLTGVGMFMVPGLGMLYGAGALAGVLAGFDFGLIGGGIASLFTAHGMHLDDGAKYNHFLKEGKILVVAEGTPDEVHQARALINDRGLHSHVDTHMKAQA